MSENKEVKRITTRRGLSVPLWVEQAQWLQAMKSVGDARESTRLQAAQAAMLNMEAFLIEHPDVMFIKAEWNKNSLGDNIIVFTLFDVDEQAIDAKLYPAQAAYARGQSVGLVSAWPKKHGLTDFVTTRARPFDELGPILLGDELYGAWAAERESRVLEQGLDRIHEPLGPRKVNAL